MNHNKKKCHSNLVFSSAEDLIQELLVGELLSSSNHNIIKLNTKMNVRQIKQRDTQF